MLKTWISWSKEIEFSDIRSPCLTMWLSGHVPGSPGTAVQITAYAHVRRQSSAHAHN